MQIDDTRFWPCNVPAPNGIQTFYNFCEEEYNRYEGKDRYIKILKLIDELYKKLKEERQDLYQVMQPILNHNYNMCQKQSDSEAHNKNNMKIKYQNSIVNRIQPLLTEGQSIVVLSSYRTGSTALCRLLSTSFNLLNLGELFHRINDPAIYGDYKKQPCVVKIQADQLVHPCWEDLTSNAYIIGLTRRSLLDQIGSFYCCHTTGVWHRYSGSTRQEYEIKWTKDDLEDQCRYIMEINKKYQDLRHICAQEFKYEDICDELQCSGMEKMIPPSNYTQLRETITNCLTSLEHHDN